MDYRSIDNLLFDILNVINFPDPEDIRYRVGDYARLIFNRIGKELVGHHEQQPLQVRGHVLKLSPEIIAVDDLNLDGYDWQGHVTGPAYRSDALLAHKRHPQGLFFPNYREGSLVARVLSLPRDESGQYYFPCVEAYEAVFKYSLSQLMIGQYQNPAYSERRSFEQDADTMVARATVELMGDSSARDRTMRYAMGNLTSSEQNSRFFTR